jgi:hypothetical protein
MLPFATRSCGNQNTTNNLNGKLACQQRVSRIQSRVASFFEGSRKQQSEETCAMMPSKRQGSNASGNKNANTETCTSKHPPHISKLRWHNQNQSNNDMQQQYDQGIFAIFAIAHDEQACKGVAKEAGPRLKHRLRLHLQSKLKRPTATKFGKAYRTPFTTVRKHVRHVFCFRK